MDVMTPSCARTDCRTSLDDESTVYCPHGTAFCGLCTWEEGCPDCSAAVPDLVGALAGATQQARDVRRAEYDPGERVTVHCRCGAHETHGRDIQPVADLRAADGIAVIERVDSLRRCRTCPHGIHVGQRCIRWNPRGHTSVAADYYHPECVVTP